MVEVADNVTTDHRGRKIEIQPIEQDSLMPLPSEHQVDPKKEAKFKISKKYKVSRPNEKSMNKSVDMASSNSSSPNVNKQKKRFTEIPSSNSQLAI